MIDREGGRVSSCSRGRFAAGTLRIVLGINSKSAEEYLEKEEENILAHKDMDKVSVVVHPGGKFEPLLLLCPSLISVSVSATGHYKGADWDFCGEDEGQWSSL